MRSTAVTTQPRVSKLSHSSFADFVEGREVAIVYAHGAEDRGFSPKLATYFADELGGAVAFGSLEWPSGIGAPWFGRRISEEVRRQAQFLWAFRDGYYLFRHGIGTAYAGLPDLDKDKVFKGHLIALGVGLVFNSSNPGHIWQDFLSEVGIEPTILHFDATITHARAHEAKEQQRHQEQRQQEQRQRRARRASDRDRRPPPPEQTEPDPYEALGVSRSATAREIKAKFRELERANHPDRVANMDPKIQDFANARLRGIIQAYDRIKRERGDM